MNNMVSLKKSNARKASEEDLNELRRISDIAFEGSRVFFYSTEKYNELTFSELKKLFKSIYTFEAKRIVFFRKDLPIELLTYLYKKNKGLKFQGTPIEYEWRRLERAEMLGLIACHPNVSLKLMMSIANHPSPEARLIATENQLMPPILRNEIYKEIVKNQGYGDKVILLKTLAKGDILTSLRNQGFQTLFAVESFVTDERDQAVFPEELSIRMARNFQNYSEDDYCEHNIREGLRNHEEMFRRVISTLAFVDRLSMKTVNRIISSEHYHSLIYLCSNKYLPSEAYEKLFDYSLKASGLFKFNALAELAANPSVPPQRLKELVGLMMPELSFKRRGSYYSQVAVHLAGNPSAPLESLLTLHSLHNLEAVERLKNGTATPDDYESETSGAPFWIWRAVEENPTYKQWVAETPNHKDLLPPIIKCTCHNL